MKTFASFLDRARNALLLAIAVMCGAFVVGRFGMAGQRGAVNFRTTLRTARSQAVITDAGASAKLKLYNGTRPSGVSAVSGGNTLLATVTFGSTIGTATSGTLDFDEAGATQNNANHVNGTPTFCDITTSGDAVVFRIDIGGGAGQWSFSGTVATGQNVTLTSLLFTEGNA